MRRVQIEKRLKGLGDAATARLMSSFFKSGPGQYGEGDIFVGIKLAGLRKLADELGQVKPRVVASWLQSPIHEVRALALLVWVRQYPKSSPDLQAEIIGLYLDNTRHINNWDLVDGSAPYLLGRWLVERERHILNQLVVSPSLWERRIGIVTTWWFIRQDDFADTLRLAKMLLGDREDLIHKATGWMLREVGKRRQDALTRFLDKHAAAMPRTMLRYAIERMSQPDRRRYMELGK